MNNLATGGSGRLDIAAGALLDAQANNALVATVFGDLNSLPGFPVVNNAGTFRKSAGVGTTTVSTPFNNAGTVEVQTGAVSFTQGIQGPTGTAQTTSGAQLTLGAASTVGTLTNNGTLNLGTNNITAIAL